MIKDLMKNKKKQIVFFAVVTALSLLCAYAVERLCAHGSIRLSMDLESPREGFIKIFYLEPGDSYFSEQKTIVSQKIRSKENSVLNFNIPSEKITKFRIDFENFGRTTHVIRNLILTGRKQYSIKDMEFSSFNIRELRQQDDTLTVQAEPNDPYITVSLSEAVEKKVTSDRFLVGIVFFLSFMLLAAAGKKILILLEDDADWADILFVLIVLGALLVPASHISKEKISAGENRTLAVRPSVWSSDNKLNVQFGQQFEAYFNDRFLGRNYLLHHFHSWKTRFNKLGKNYNLSDAIVEYDNGWMFYRLENSFRNFQNIDVFTAEELDKNLKFLMKLDDYCRKNDIKFYYFIAPDKNKVYGEHLDCIRKINPDSRSRANLWVQYVRKKSNIKVIYPVEELKRQKGNGLLFYKNDTHWSCLGSYYGYLELMKIIKKDFPELQVFKPTVFTEETRPHGDLTFFTAAKSKAATKYKKPFLEKNIPEGPSSVIRFDFKNPAGKKKALVLRDSFGNAILSYFYATFADTSSNWVSVMKKQDYSAELAQKPDILIFLHVERNLPWIVKRMSENF